ncbi:MAG: hypothetical protein ACE5JN_09005 [Candidatus Methylomirabilia bacterium]
MVGVVEELEEMIEMILKLIHHSQTLPLTLPANEGFDLSEIKAILQRLEDLGLSWEIIDTTTRSEEELSNLYAHATLPTANKKYHVRQVFGSKRHSAYLFGKGVPALMVYEQGKQYPSDLYPHRAGSRIVTIRIFLEDLLKRFESAPMTVERREANKGLVDRMDRLRRKIGPIGVCVTKLIAEGRRR